MRYWCFIETNYTTHCNKQWTIELQYDKPTSHLLKKHCLSTNALHYNIGVTATLALYIEDSIPFVFSIHKSAKMKGFVAVAFCFILVLPSALGIACTTSSGTFNNADCNACRFPSNQDLLTLCGM